MAATMFERYGGFAKVSRIVSAFYDKILDSPITSPYFANIDMRKQIDHQSKFISQIMGGPASYSDEELQRRHERLNVDEAAFNEMAALLVETLEDFDIADSDIAVLKHEIVSRKHLIVKR